MYLFIFESIGTSELMLIGIVALIFLGPRKMPEMARKIGKMMAEFRGTANEFKETWQREVDFSEEAKSLDLKTLEAEAVARVATSEPIAAFPDASPPADAPTIKAVDPADFEHLRPAESIPPAATESSNATDVANDKKNWL